MFVILWGTSTNEYQYRLVNISIDETFSVSGTRTCCILGVSSACGGRHNKTDGTLTRWSYSHPLPRPHYDRLPLIRQTRGTGNGLLQGLQNSGYMVCFITLNIMTSNNIVRIFNVCRFCLALNSLRECTLLKNFSSRCHTVIVLNTRHTTIV